MDVDLSELGLIPESVYYVSASLVLGFIYVGSLYIWELRNPDSRPLPRNHPDTIKKRCFSVFAVTLLSPIYSYLVCDRKLIETHGMMKLLGLKYEGLVMAVICPLSLTAILFLGPLTTWKLSSIKFFALDREDSDHQVLRFLRDVVISPFSEELVFRACMVPLLMPVLNSHALLIFICPLFFGVAHFHHGIENIRNGIPVFVVLISVVFQMTYTSLFGAYSTFLYLRTGHLIAPCVVHAFCNHVGLPNLTGITKLGNKMYIILAAYVAGLIGWICLLMPLTEPGLYGESLFWSSLD